MDNGKEVEMRYCPNCGVKDFAYTDDFEWDTSGYTVAKIFKCKRCGQTVPIEFIEEDNINYDLRYYIYKTKN